MSSTSEETTPNGQSVPERQAPTCLAISEKGVTTANQFAHLMSALMSDLIAERIDPLVANTTIKAGGKLLKIVEMKYKYGGNDPNSDHKVLRLLD